MTKSITAARAGIAIFLIASGTLWNPAAAQARAEAYRCGNTYTDRPCEGGKPVKVDDSRTEADRRAADAGTHKAEARADQLERIRLSQEKEAYERGRRSASDSRQAAIAERRLASSEQLARARAQKLGAEPRKSSARFSGPADGKQGPAPGDSGKKKKRKSGADSSAG